MDISFDQACGLVENAVRGGVRREIVSGLSAKTLGASLAQLRDAMRANRFRAASQQIFLDRVVTAFDGRTRADGFHILHDWDGKAQRTNPDIIPIDVLHFIAEQRGGDPSTEVEPAILLDYYFMHLIALLTMRAWDEGDPNQNLDRLNAMVAELQGPNGSGQQFAADAETMMLIGTSHYELEEWGYARLLDKARTLDEAHQFAVGLGHASSMGCHLRFGFEAQCGRDTLLLRDDNIADYPWLCFALAAVMKEYSRLADAGIENRDRAVDRRSAVERPDRRCAGVHWRCAIFTVGLRARARGGGRGLLAPQGVAAGGVQEVPARRRDATRRCRCSSTSPTTS